MIIGLLISCGNSNKKEESLIDNNQMPVSFDDSIYQEFTSQGNYIFEFANNAKRQYATIIFYFPEKTFKNTVYEIGTDNEKKPIISFAGSWNLSKGNKTIHLAFAETTKQSDWEFLAGFQQIKNPSGLVFSRSAIQSVPPQDNVAKNYDGDCDRDFASEKLISLLVNEGMEIVDGPYYSYDVASTEEDICQIAFQVAYMNSKDSIKAIINCELIVRKVSEKWDYVQEECTVD